MRGLFLFIFMLSLGIILIHFNILDYLSFEKFNRYNQQILVYKNTHLIKFISIYIAAYLLLVTMCIPGTVIFDILAGFLFTPLNGIIIVVISYGVGSIINFLMIKFLFADFFKRKLSRVRNLSSFLTDNTPIAVNKLTPNSVNSNHNKINQQLTGQKYPYKQLSLNLISLRIIPVMPFWAVNLLAVLLNVPFKIFIVTLITGILPATVVYVLIGNSFKASILAGKMLTSETLSDPKVWLPLVLLALLIIIPNFISSFKRSSKSKLN